MKNLKCLMTDIPKINREFKASVDQIGTNLLLSSVDRLRLIQARVDCREFEHFSCTVEGE